MEPIKLGCVHCGKAIEITPPDLRYTEPHRKYKKNSFDDMIETKRNCLWCNQSNDFYWYIPDNKH